MWGVLMQGLNHGPLDSGTSLRDYVIMNVTMYSIRMLFWLRCMAADCANMVFAPS